MLLLLRYLFSYFNFSGKLLEGSCYNFEDMFSVLLLSDSQRFNKIEILFWDIFAFFALWFANVLVWSAKYLSIGGEFKENHTKQTHADTKSYLYMNKSRLPCTPVESNFQVFLHFKAFFTLLTWDLFGRSLRKGCYRRRLKLGITSSMVVANMKQYIYINKKSLYTPIESDVQVLWILVRAF